MIRLLHRSWFLRTGAIAGLAAVLLFAVIGGGGCGGGGTTPDGDDPPEITVEPAGQGQQVRIGGNLEFSVAAIPDVALQATWRRDGIVVGSEHTYHFAADQVGRDTLRVHAEAGETARDYYWVIEVTSEPLTTPPAVPVASVEAGPEPVQVLVNWTRVSGSTYPIVDYLLAVSYTGIVTAQNWSIAQHLAAVPHVPGQMGYTATFDRDVGSLVPGAEAWFALRARDEHGQLSAEVTNRFTRITTEWWINGVVTDDGGGPLLGVVVGSAVPPRNGNSDGSGRFRLGPYRSIDSVSVATTTIDYYDFTTVRLNSAADIELELMLPAKHGVAPACTAYEGEFLNYLRHMTQTVPSESDTSASRLWNWSRYPVRVFLPDSTLAGGRQLDDLAREMVQLWNTELGGTYLVEVASVAEADVRAAWVTNASAGYGEASLELPAGGSLGNVAPVRILIEVETGINTDQFFQEVALHELGHALGLVAHSDNSCVGSGHLMVLGASGNLSLPSPIHVDELNAVRAISRLRQGVDMRRYAP